MNSDTSPKMQKIYREMLFSRTPEERFKMGSMRAIRHADSF